MESGYNMKLRAKEYRHKYKPFLGKERDGRLYGIIQYYDEHQKRWRPLPKVIEYI